VCLAAIEAATCDEFFEQNGAVAESPPECDTTFVGTVATGGSCTLDEDCAVDGDACSPETMLCAPA
jgi:hypothetical protein